jgi:hypothetical protein
MLQSEDFGSLRITVKFIGEMMSGDDAMSVQVFKLIPDVFMTIENNILSKDLAEDIDLY